MSRHTETNAVSESCADGAPRLKRTLGLWSLVIIGLVMVQPTAPARQLLAIWGKLNIRVASRKVVYPVDPTLLDTVRVAWSVMWRKSLSAIWRKEKSFTSDLSD
jgi:hypothetical protein